METRSKIIAKDRFEDIGVRLQETTRNLKEAMQRFDKSCTLCTLYKRHGDCASCPIRESLKANIEWHGYPHKDYHSREWIQKEFARD